MSSTSTEIVAQKCAPMISTMMMSCISHVNGTLYNGTLVNDSKLHDDMILPIAPLTKTETYLHIIFIGQGVPINLFIALVFLLNKQLQTPRNTFWVGIIAVNLLTILIAALRLAITYDNKENNDEDGIICFLFSFLTGKPYTILLFIQLLATMDRYYSESSPTFYKKYFTKRFVIGAQLFGFLSMFIFSSLPHLIGAAPLRCGFSLEVGKSNILIRCVLVLFCVYHYIKLNCKTRSNINRRKKALKNMQKAAQESKNSVPGNSNNKPIIKITIIGDSAVEVVSLPANETKTIEEPKTNNLPTSIKANSEEASVEPAAASEETGAAKPADENAATSEEPKTVDPADPPAAAPDSNAVAIPEENVDEEYASEWEVDATVKLVLDYISLLTVISPMLIFLFSGAFINHLCEDSSELTTTVPSIGLSFFMYGVYGPLIFCFVSKEFSKAVRQMFQSAPKKSEKEKLSSAFV